MVLTHTRTGQPGTKKRPSTNKPDIVTAAPFKRETKKLKKAKRGARKRKGMVVGDGGEGVRPFVCNFILFRCSFLSHSVKKKK